MSTACVSVMQGLDRQGVFKRCDDTGSKFETILTFVLGSERQVDMCEDVALGMTL